MKMLAILGLALSFAVAGGIASAATEPGTQSKEMHHGCMKMMDDMKDMPMGDKAGDKMGGKVTGKTHHAVGTVKGMDMAKGTVTLAHGPVKSLNWPAMTMTFGVKDKMLLDKMTEGKKVEVDFIQEGSDYTIVKVK